MAERGPVMREVPVSIATLHRLEAANVHWFAIDENVPHFYLPIHGIVYRHPLEGCAVQPWVGSAHSDHTTRVAGARSHVESEDVLLEASLLHQSVERWLS